MHRNARPTSDRAAKMHQRYYMAVIDWKRDPESKEAKKIAKATKKDGALLLAPNAYLEQWSGRRVRVRATARSREIIACRRATEPTGQ